MNNQNIIVHVDESPVGTGKTERALVRATMISARYLFVVERLDGIDELASRIAALVTPMTTSPTVLRIKSTDDEVRGHSVRTEVESLPSKFATGSHVVAICTHQAMLMSDFADFTDWHIVIDEIPNIMDKQDVRSKLDARFFVDNYTLESVTGEWSNVGLTASGAMIGGSDLQQDDSHRHLRVFHQRVGDAEHRSMRAVLCNLRAWEDMTLPEVSWTWWSLFSMDQLKSFASRTILANGFMTSVAAKMLTVWSPGVVWKPFSNTGSRPLVRRRVTVRYFAARRSSITFFQSEQGRDHLGRIGAHIASSAPHDGLIWSANDKAKPSLCALPAAAYLRPRQAGTSRFMHCDHAAMIYAVKPDASTKAVLNALGIESRDWITTNEHEVILQFVTRTSIRDVGSDRPATIYVYARDQAEYLMRFFNDQGHIDATMEMVELGLTYESSKPGPKPRALSPDEAKAKAEYKRKCRAKWERERRGRIKTKKAA